MIEVDRLMMEEFHIDLIQMMENAGRHLATLAKKRFLADAGLEARVLILAGTGGNGGGSLVCARNLHNWGVPITVVLTRKPESYAGVIGQQLDILQRMEIPVVLEIPSTGFTLAIDGLIGYSLSGPPRGQVEKLIRQVTTAKIPLLALDVPSGVDATTGAAYDPAIVATATLTLALPKLGLRKAPATKHVGELFLGDISVPPELYLRLPSPITVGNIFDGHPILRVS